jgi:hypothetical protein
MFSRLLSLSKGLVLCSAVLLATSSAQAQTSPSGHVPARTTYPLRPTAPPPFSIFPGDHMFQATMKIEHGYQAAERVAPLVRYHPPARQPSAHEEAAGVEVAVTEPEESMEKIAIRGPNGEVRYFPIVGGRKAIKARTIIVRPGQTIHLVVQGTQVTVSHK